ncbi:hypothetical protein P5673_014419 [Acropora cervicornis]|uniref:Uncharacterized protein n=1 Tax=Acropora cervicornis TaxID=6130 RepID=A0AAD9V661_ACRCE|nr:hypothetical protein P5673_014419 [Acropora cervicornis]
MLPGFAESETFLQKGDLSTADRLRIYSEFVGSLTKGIHRFTHTKGRGQSLNWSLESASSSAKILTNPDPM